MKLKLVTSGLTRALVVVATLIFISGCANQVANQSKVHVSNASGPNVEKNVKKYKVMALYRNMGNTIVPVQHDWFDTISIDLNTNTILWNQRPLRFVSSESGESVFFDGAWLIQIKGRSSHLNSSVAIGHQVFTPGKPIIWDHYCPGIGGAHTSLAQC